MRKPFRHRLLLALVAFAMAAGAHAQTKEGTVELPIWNQASGKLEAILLLEPTNQLSVGGSSWVGVRGNPSPFMFI